MDETGFVLNDSIIQDVSQLMDDHEQQQQQQQQQQQLQLQ